MRLNPRELQAFINRNNIGRDIYHDLRPFRVKEILLISHLYDAYLIEGEGKFSEIILSDYASLNLTYLPRITAISFDEDVSAFLEKRNIDMIVMMIGLDSKTPMKMARSVRSKHPDIPMFFLLSQKTYLDIYMAEQKKGLADMIFMWNNDSRIFFSMVKYLEDKMNADNDTSLASVSLILIVEDSALFYSSYLVALYDIIFRQTNKIISEIWTDFGYKVLKLRTRPKVLLATNYEEATSLFKKYENYINCLLTDIRFEKDDIIDDEAGLKLVDYVKSIKPELPVIVMSSEQSIISKTESLNVQLVDKNSDLQMASLSNLVLESLNFGDFVFRDQNGKELERASTISQFENLIKVVDNDTLLYHSAKDEFSKWLRARSEIQLAKILYLKKANDFSSPDEIRNFILETIRQYRDEKPYGNIVPISSTNWDSEGNIIMIGKGSKGGKGRGIAFANSVIYQFKLIDKFKGLKLQVPKTAAIGMRVFEEFLTKSKLDLRNIPSHKEVKKIFGETEFDMWFEADLRKLLKRFTKPLAIRSSGSYEDSISIPFSGIFETYVLPNNHPNDNIRLNHLLMAIKMVYASVFSETSINYAKALDIKIGDEKMAVVIQELVGFEYKGLFFPHISGVAQSYNFYPFDKMEAKDGFAVIALGFGRYVADGENAYRFSPRHPEIQAMSTNDQVRFSQKYFYALNLDNQDIDFMAGPNSTLVKTDIEDIGKDPLLTHCASVFNRDENRLYPGIYKEGEIVINFASVLKHEYVPVSRMIDFLLEFFENGFGSPVELEFAVDLNDPPSLHFLQIKPLLKAINSYSINEGEADPEKTLLYSEKIMGNGMIETLKDVIVVKPEVFDKTLTEEIALQIDKMNNKMVSDELQYVLIGPGRWGTKDRFLGVPITWPQISNARVIVETDLEGFPLDASFGSHFFHNLTTFNIAYFSVVQTDDSFINFGLLDYAALIEETPHLRHYRFKNNIAVKMDGKKRKALIEIKD